ncbi:alkaline phosphatase family protein [Ferviditalea candida]|uniref:Alkaline phosphatase family protein n=1 Tax=Ferviditalea candida TaxID=3108399 RepID=A0ABU5ZJA5_9BACL|nr:alkaline phosphatase family protein [Paenibacillaceae bacterium T2]
MKKVILLLVDSLMSHVLDNCIRDRTVPAFQFLISKGRYWPDCVTVFPTMTASVDSSLLTGEYPDVHRIPGLIWYEPTEKKIVNYINGWKCVQKLGVANCVEHVLHNLNEQHLSPEVTTIFEELEQQGLTSASINAIVHRASKKHKVRLPFFPDMITGFRFHNEVTGPEIMTLGALLDTEIEAGIPKTVQSAMQRYGINDDYAITAVRKLIESGRQPDFTLVYLPDNDHEVHKKNPEHAEESLVKVDRKLQTILNAFDSWEEAVERCVFIAISDHGQTRIGKSKEYNIDLDFLLEGYKVLQLDEQENDGHELVVCNNERMAYLYPLKLEKMQEIIRTLQRETKIDLIAWKQDRGVIVRESGSGKELSFIPGGDMFDVYGRAWTVEGSLEVLDLKLERGTIHFADYPDALSRLYGALYSQDTPVIAVTARPRYEFKSRYFPLHLNGGSHGSLHKFDSVIPLIITGTNMPIKEPTRLVDIKEIVLNLLLLKNAKK